MRKIFLIDQFGFAFVDCWGMALSIPDRIRCISVWPCCLLVLGIGWVNSLSSVISYLIVGFNWSQPKIFVSFQVKCNHGHKRQHRPMKTQNQSLRTLHMLAMLTKASKWANNAILALNFRYIEQIVFKENKSRRYIVVRIEVPNCVGF